MRKSAEKGRKRVTMRLTVPLEIAPARSFPGLYEEVATVQVANGEGEYRLGRCVAGTALHIFRPNGQSRLVVPLAGLYRAIMDEVFRLDRESAL